MKTRPALLHSIGALLALFVLIAFPSSSTLADGPCYPPVIYYDYDAGPTGIRTLMYCPAPYGARIFYTTDGSNPTHNNGTPTGNTSEYLGYIPVDEKSCMFFKALAWKQNYLNSSITSATVCNPPP